MTLGQRMRDAELDRLRGEVEALRSAIGEAIMDLDAEHGPEWTSEEMRAKGKEPIGCRICYPGDSNWPCLLAMVLEDLRRALEAET